MRREQWWPPVRDLAEEQGGLFTAAQARTAGARRPQLADLLHAGTIDRVQHGIYRLTGTPRTSGSTHELPGSPLTRTSPPAIASRTLQAQAESSRTAPLPECSTSAT